MTGERGRVGSGQLGLAVVLLVGVLVTAYGYFQQSQVGLYVGLLVTAAGVLVGVLQVVMRGDR